MAPLAIRTSAPGSLMLFGEHAVLHGRLALVAAIHRRIRVELAPRPGTRIRISSSLGTLETDLRHIETHPDFRFVLAVLRRKADRLPSGFDLRIESDFPPTIGFGSSAAVTAAFTAALAQWTCGTVDADALFDSCLETIREVQGMGSGADLAASVHGGLVLYRAEPREIERLAAAHPLTAVYAGYKRPTPEVVALVEARRREFPQIFNHLFDAAEQCAMDAADAAVMKDWKTFGALMNTAQGVMDAMGVNDARLTAIVQALRADPGIHGAKISGSGLGDCAVGLGRVAAAFPMDAIPLDVEPEGARLESN